MTAPDPARLHQSSRQPEEDGGRVDVKHNHARWSNNGGPWSACPDKCPARDSGRDEAREAVARWLWQVYGDQVDPLDRHPGQWDTDAEHLLAHPAVRKLLRRPA